MLHTYITELKLYWRDVQRDDVDCGRVQDRTAQRASLDSYQETTHDYVHDREVLPRVECNRKSARGSSHRLLAEGAHMLLLSFGSAEELGTNL